jgi:hypothetical protein
MTPRLVEPFGGLQPPLSLMSPALMRELAGPSGWSPAKEEGGMESFPGFNFSLPMHRSSRTVRSF